MRSQLPDPVVEASEWGSERVDLDIARTLDDDEPAPQDSWVHRLRPLGDGVRVLQSRHGDAWFDLYSFAPEPQHLADYESYNWYTSTHPRSPFTRGMVVQRTGGSVRHSLTRSVLTTVHAGGATDRRRLDDDGVIDTLGHLRHRAGCRRDRRPAGGAGGLGLTGGQVRRARGRPAARCASTSGP